MNATRGMKTHDMARQFERTASSLPPADLPTFYERAARELIGKGDVTRGATMFAKACAAESAAGASPIADDDWLELHREFAAFGALNTKTVADFVKALKTRAAPEIAVQALAQVALLRARAGQAPWPQLPKQLSAFAAAAGLDELTVHRDLLIPLLATEPIWESAAAMWIAWRPILVRLCAESAQLRGLLLNLRPEPEDMDGWWLELLDECGATAGLVGAAEPGAEPAGGRAAWLERTVWHPCMNRTRRRRRRYGKLLPPQVSDLIERMAPVLRTDGVPVRLEGPDYWTKRIDVRVLEVCLRNGIPLAPLSDEAGLGLDLWLQGRHPQDDLEATIKHPEFGPWVLKWAQKGDPVLLWVVPALRPHLQLPPETAGKPHPLDGPRIYSAVHEFGEAIASSIEAKRRPLHTLGVLTKALREGTASSIDRGDLHLGENTYLAGNIEWPVLRAIAPSTPPYRRELLIAFLQVWGESVLADPATHIFRGTADMGAPRLHPVVADEHGVAMRTAYCAQGPEPFLALTDGTPGAEPPSLGRIHTVEQIPVGWGTTDRLHKLVALVSEHGGVPRDPAAAAVLAERAGLGRCGAAMALAGLLGITGYRGEFFMGPEERKALGISAAEAEAGRKELAWVRDQQRLDVLRGILPEDPAELWEPGGMVAVAGRLAENWVAEFGVDGAGRAG